jgi:hypothetical protein
MIGAMAGSATPTSSSSGWAALRAADWEAARAALEAELAHQETAAALDGLARAKDLLGGQPDSIEWGCNRAEAAAFAHRHLPAGVPRP